MNNSDRRTIGIIAVIVTTLLCACPGLILLTIGGISGVMRVFFSSELSGSDVNAALAVAITGLCLGILMIAVPLEIALFAFRGGPGQPRSAVVDVAPPPPPQPVRPVEPEPVNMPPFVVPSSQPPAPASTEGAVVIVDSEEAPKPAAEAEEPPTFDQGPDEPEEQDPNRIPPAI